MKSKHSADQVRIIQFKKTRVACLAHRGDPQLIGDSIRQFIEWRKQNNLGPSNSATFNIVYDDPFTTDPDHYRLDLCASTNQAITKNALGIVEQFIPAGRCAVLRHVGTDDNLRTLVKYLYSEWFPDSGEAMRDFPLFFQRVRFFPEVPENEAITDVFLPLK